MPATLSAPTFPSRQDDPAVCVGCEGRRRGICGSLVGDQLADLARISSRKCIPAGGRIGRAVAHADSFGVILSGVVSLSKNLPDGRHQIVGLQFAPSFVGRPFRVIEEMEATASSQVRICTFPRSSFEGILAENAQLEHRVLLETLSQLDDTRDWLMSLGRKTALERVASYLEMIARHSPPSAAGGVAAAFAMPLSRGDMADFLGLTIETVSRKMTELRKAGIIDFKTALAVRVCSPAGLHHASGN